MKKISVQITGLTLLLILGGGMVITPHSATAQINTVPPLNPAAPTTPTNTTNSSNPTNTVTAPISPTLPGSGTNTGGSTSVNTTSNATALANAKAADNAAAQPSDCGLFHLTQCLASVANTLLSLVGLVTQLGGVTFNFAMQYTVIDMKTHLADITALNTTWGTVRDIANMGFIFVLLFSAIQSIIGGGSKTQELIKKIVIAALLINFSLFFTKVIIDAANLIALLFYNALVPSSATATTILDHGISNTLMQALHLQTIWAANAAAPGPATIISVAIVGSIVLLVAAFCFFAVAIMLAIRFVILLLVMVLSPLAFVGNILPNMQITKQFWPTLLGQAFFAPIYLFLTWVSISLLSGMNLGGNLATAISGTLGPSGASVIASPSPTVLGTIFNFLVVIIFMIASIVMAKDFAGRGVSGLGKIYNSALGLAGSTSFGMVGRLGRGTIGRAAQSRADNEDLKDRAAAGSFSARLQLAAARKTAGASFDGRNTVVGDQLGAGKGQKGGFAKDMADKVKKETDYAKSLAPSDAAKAIINAKSDQANKHLETARAAAEVEVDEKYKKPAELEKLEKNLKQAESMATNPTMSQAGRELAKERADQIRVQRDAANANYQKGREAQINRIIEPDKTAAATATANKEKLATAGRTRAETYATSVEQQRTFGQKFDIFGRILGGGPVKREYLAAAEAIRKANKQKTKKEQAADLLAQDAAEEAKKKADEDTAAKAAENTGSQPANP